MVLTRQIGAKPAPVVYQATPTQVMGPARVADLALGVVVVAQKPLARRGQEATGPHPAAAAAAAAVAGMVPPAVLAATVVLGISTSKCTVNQRTFR